MEFTVEFYETVNGRSPVEEFLEELRASTPAISLPCWLGWQNCAIANIIGKPLSKALGDGLFELRHVGKLNTRVLWFFVKGRRIVAAHGIRNKGQSIPIRDLNTARERMRDWQKRF